MADRLGRRTMALVPLARPLVQAEYLLRLLVLLACLQYFSEEGMIAVPLALVV